MEVREIVATVYVLLTKEQGEKRNTIQKHPLQNLDNTGEAFLCIVHLSLLNDYVAQGVCSKCF